MPDCVPFFKPGDTVTCHAIGAIVGSNFVCIAGLPVDGNPGIAHGGSPEQVFGVAARDRAIGGKVMAYSTPGIILPIKIAAAGAVVNGDRITTNAAGEGIVAGAGVAYCALVLEDTAAGGFAMCKLQFGMVAA